MTDMTEALVLIVGGLLVVALAIYVLFGGADFGGGVLEATLPGPLRKKLQSTMAPIWEANHVWLIAVVVILFVGFPRFYSGMLTRLYVPVSLALLAVLLRGVFFTLRKYDPEPGRLAGTYSTLFSVSSFGAPVAYGLVLGGLLSIHPGSLEGPPEGASFARVYLEPWLHLFGLLCGAFIASLFAYLAAVFFFGELELPTERLVVRHRAEQFFAATFVLGGLVLVGGALSGRVPVRQALSPLFLVSQVIALAGIVVVGLALRKGRPWLARLAAGGQVLAILGGWFSAQYPTLLRTEAGELTLSDAAAPAVTLFWLAVGLVIVLSLVIPLLVLLYRVFRPRQLEASSSLSKGPH